MAVTGGTITDDRRHMGGHIVRNRRILAVAAAAMLGVAGLAAQAAWACVPQPLVYVEPMSSGPAGSQVTVTASAISGDAEIRWNSSQGPQLATATGPHFSVPVTVPADAQQGLYSVLVLSRAPGGAVTGSGQAAFLVTAPGGSPTGGPASGAPATGGPASGAPSAGGAASASTPKPRASHSAGGVRGAGLVFGGLAVLLVGLILGAVIDRVAKRGSAGNPQPGSSPATP